MNIYSILLFVFAAAVCMAFSGCGNVPAQTPPIEQQPLVQQLSPIEFVADHTLGMQDAQKRGMPTLAFFSMPDNAGSQRMMETAFCNAEIKRLAERFICIHVDGSQEPLLCKTLEISSFPTVLISDTNGIEVRRLVGKQTPDQLAVQMHVVLQTRAFQSGLTIER